jgi:histidine ammonia-lyase
MIDTIKESRRILEIEINSATDNPLIFVDDSEIDVISGGNFHGQALAIVSDTLAVNCHEIGSISERRTNQILDPDWSNQNAFLAQNEGLESGLMILQYVSAAVLAEMNLLANSVTTTNIPVSLGKEDHVSMGATGSYRLLQQTKFLSLILANEFICSSVALDNISEPASDSVSKIHDWIRETVPPLMGDRAFSIETENLASKILDGLLCNIFEE